jgi:hypothetical protein
MRPVPDASPSEDLVSFANELARAGSTDAVAVAAERWTVTYQRCAKAAAIWARNIRMHTTTDAPTFPPRNE